MSESEIVAALVGGVYEDPNLRDVLIRIAEATERIAGRGYDEYRLSVAACQFVCQ